MNYEVNVLHLIRKVEYIENYKLKLTFNDKKQKIVDLKKFSKEGPDTVFYPFRNLEFFKSVKLDRSLGTIVWPNGSIFVLMSYMKLEKKLKENDMAFCLLGFFIVKGLFWIWAIAYFVFGIGNE
jgi:Protein of unknown function (DUF2442)